MFQFTGLPLLALFDSGESTRALPRVGFPIRKSRDQRSVSTSSGLIAAAHVLLRLLAPRHPPCALVLLIRKNTHVAAMEFSRCAPTARVDGLSKLNSVRHLEVDVVPGEPRTRTTRRPSTSSTPAGVRAPAFPRKEVIQPQLPLRLPCYDFTPITDSTFGRCLPYGLAHGLRVFPAFVV
jgi:hypothetical protein